MISQLGGRHRAVHLRELSIAFFYEEQMVSVDRHGEPESETESHLGRAARGEIVTSNDPGHTADRIIDNTCQVVGDRAVATADDRIAKGLTRVEAQVAPPLVDRRHRTFGQHHAQRVTARPPTAIAHRGKGATTTSIRVAKPAIGGAAPFAADIRPTAAARIEVTVRGQGIQTRLVRAMSSRLFDRAIPVEAEPLEIVHHAAGELRLAAVRIEVLEAQFELRSRRPRVEPAQ